MESFSVRQFERSDIKFAYESTIIENWNNSKEDIERMFRYNPSGCFIAEVEGKRAGHVFSVKYGKLGWIGLLIVRAEYRGKGIGTSLMKKAVNHLLSREAETVKLEAVPEIASLYRKFGFVDEYDSLRFSGRNRKITSITCLNVKLLKKEMLKEIARFDAEYFGANRINVLSRIYLDNSELCFVSYAGAKIVGYVMCCKGEKGYRVGPWVCNPENPQAARELLTRCMETIGENVELYAGVLVANKTAVEIMREFGFKQYSRSIRMRLGKELKSEHINGIFSIGGPEKG